MTSTSSNIIKDLGWFALNLKAQQRSTSIGERVLAKCKDISNVVSQKLHLAKEIELEVTSTTQPANRFMIALKRVEFHHAYMPTISADAPYGYFRNRPIIGENTKVQGGIYIGSSAHEALVVDEKYGALSKILSQLVARISGNDPTKTSYDYEVFSQAVALARESLRYSEEGVEQLHKKYHIQSDEKVTLDLYVQKKIGVARHQILLTAFLLEKLFSNNLLKGKFAIDSQISSDVYQERLLFTSNEGEVLRFDPTKGLGKTAIH